ncbi:alpha/beta hydrolase [Vibrio sp. PP-XX7]
MSGLAQHRRILVDLLGSGFSDKPEHFSYSIAAHADSLEALINHLELNEFYIYGHSMGGAISITLAARYRTRVKGLILSESNLDSGGGFFSQKIAAYHEQDYLNFGHDEIIQASQAESNENWAAALSISSPLAIYREARSLITGQSPSWRQLFYALTTSKSYLFGERSLPDPDFAALGAENIRLDIVPDAGHSMAWENPEGLATAIKKAISVI